MGTKFNGHLQEKQPVIILGSDMNGVDVSSEVSKSLKSLGFAFKEVVGSYENIDGKIVNEKSFVVICPCDNTYKTLIGLAVQFDQESILYLDENRNADLIFLNHSFYELNLGKFTPLTTKQFKLLDEKFKKSYTFDGDYYYVTI